MIERIERTHTNLNGTHIPPWSYNFASASLLELSFRVRPSEGNNYARYHQAVTGLELTFGIGNPPDFAAGNLQTVLLPVPDDLNPVHDYTLRNEIIGLDQVGIARQILAIEAKITAIQKKIEATKEREIFLNLRVATLFKVYEKTESGSKEHYEAEAAVQSGQEEQIAIKGEIAELAAEKAQIETELAEAKNTQKKIEVEAKMAAEDIPSSWSPYIDATFQRDFDAIRFEPIGVSFSFPFDLEERLTVYRLGDVGPTYTTPFATSPEGG